MSEPVFFVDHDTIHNRVTGKHVTLEEACEMLNAESTTRIAWGAVVETGKMLRAAEAQLTTLTAEVERLRGEVASYHDAQPHPIAPDSCKFCLGAKGGARGNENVIGGVVACDYCHVLLGTATAPLTAVVEAAKAWHTARCSRRSDCDPYEGTHDSDCAITLGDSGLIAAIDALTDALNELMLTAQNLYNSRSRSAHRHPGRGGGEVSMTDELIALSEPANCGDCMDEPALHCVSCGAMNRDAVWDELKHEYRKREHAECICSAYSTSECACGGCDEQDADERTQVVADATAPLIARIHVLESALAQERGRVQGMKDTAAILQICQGPFAPADQTIACKQCGLGDWGDECDAFEVAHGEFKMCDEPVGVERCWKSRGHRGQCMS